MPPPTLTFAPTPLSSPLSSPAATPPPIPAAAAARAARALPLRACVVSFGPSKAGATVYRLESVWDEALARAMDASMDVTTGTTPVRDTNEPRPSGDVHGTGEGTTPVHAKDTPRPSYSPPTPTGGDRGGGRKYKTPTRECSSSAAVGVVFRRFSDFHTLHTALKEGLGLQAAFPLRRAVVHTDGLYKRYEHFVLVFISHITHKPHTS